MLDASDRIPFAGRLGGYLYNFWQDADHPRGLWRRTTLEQYRLATPEWDVLLDVDALASQENESWVWDGVTLLRPGGYRLALVRLSRGGADACVVREFDVQERRFVEDGFRLPEAKSDVGWIDADRIYVATDFGPGSLTSSGYPRVVKEWRRGTPLSEATVVYEGKPEDVSVRRGPRSDRRVRTRLRGARHRQLPQPAVPALRTAGWCRLEVPDDAMVGVHREWLLIDTRSPWTAGGVSYPAGVLLAIRFEAFLAGDRELTVLFEPDPHSCLHDYAWTRGHLILSVLRDVRSQLAVLTPADGRWRRSALAGRESSPTPTSRTPIRTTATSTCWHPAASPSLTRCATGTSAGRWRCSSGAGFLRRHRAVGAPVLRDLGGRHVGALLRRAAGSRGPRPTLLTGYGGFEMSLTPGYDGVIGRGWLARGGTYVMANLRGGGEYGPDWHSSATKEHRHRVYEDFAAVAADLVTRGVTTPDRLGIEGTSNGGLLTGVMLTRYPRLFGAIVSQVPLLDMRRYHELLAGASWMAEYGDPRGAGRVGLPAAVLAIPQRARRPAVSARAARHVHQG